MLVNVLCYHKWKCWLWRLWRSKAIHCLSLKGGSEPRIQITKVAKEAKRQVKQVHVSFWISVLVESKRIFSGNVKTGLLRGRDWARWPGTPPWNLSKCSKRAGLLLSERFPKAGLEGLRFVRPVTVSDLKQCWWGSGNWFCPQSSVSPARGNVGCTLFWRGHQISVTLLRSQTCPYPLASWLLLTPRNCGKKMVTNSSLGNPRFQGTINWFVNKGHAASAGIF